MADNEGELSEALEFAFAYEDKILAESDIVLGEDKVADHTVAFAFSADGREPFELHIAPLLLVYRAVFEKRPVGIAGHDSVIADIFYVC